MDRVILPAPGHQWRDTVYHFEYDNFDNTTSISVGANKEYILASYVYAAKNGLLTTQTYGNGDKVEFTYDILGRTKTATYSDSEGEIERVLTYVYTGDGQLYSIHDSSTGYTYLYTYDNIGRLIASCVKSGGTVLMQTRQEYDANNQMTAQHWTVGDTTYSQTFTYNKQEGMVTAMTTGNGHSIQLEYDALRRLSSVTGGVYERKYTYKDVSDTNTTPLVSGYHYKNSDGEIVYSFGYTYDVLGNIASHTDASGTQVYTYDAQNQLTRVRKSGTTLYEYTYDNAGNILTASNGTTTHTYTYGNTVWKDLLTAFDGETITYDGSGNPVSYYNGKRYTFTWEEGRNLVSAVQGTNTYTYAYDQNGVRVSKEENGKTHTYLYASGNLLRETISENNVVTDVLDFFYDHNGYPCELNHTANGTTTTYYYITNLQGDVLYLLDSGKNVVATYSYDPYGKVLTATGDMANINPLRYRGYYYDTETGFYYLHTRYYDSTICRYLNADTVFDYDTGIPGYNLFAYCGNHPIDRIDISGKDSDGVEDLDDAFEPEAKLAGASGPGNINSTATATSSSNKKGFLRSLLDLFDLTLQTIKDGFSGLGGEIRTTPSEQTVSLCFVAGTLVKTGDGVVPIDEIQVGDTVWSWDEETGDVALKEVVETYINQADELVHVFVDGEEIVTTPSHPFYSPVNGWTDAVQLRAGDILVLVNGEYVIVEKVQHEILEAPIEVYNFQVKDYHTYYVANAGILVHNECSVDDVLADATDTTSSKGISTNYEKSGGYNQAFDDFNHLNQAEPRVISTKYGDGLLGEHNGANLVLRPGSSQGYPTLELQVSTRHIIKIRYLGQSV